MELTDRGPEMRAARGIESRGARWLPRDVETLRAADPRRAGLERFISASFSRRYGASIEHYAEVLIGVGSPDGGWVAAVGYTPAAARRLFLEQYLNEPIETLIGRITGQHVARQGVVEVGNLAAHSAGAARWLIAHMTMRLHRERYAWVAFTATQALLNSFARLGLASRVLAHADPHRLADHGARWGSYYAERPRVVVSAIAPGYSVLRALARRRPSVDRAERSQRATPGPY